MLSDEELRVMERRHCVGKPYCESGAHVLGCAMRTSDAGKLLAEVKRLRAEVAKRDETIRELCKSDVSSRAEAASLRAVVDAAREITERFALALEHADACQLPARGMHVGPSAGLPLTNAKPSVRRELWRIVDDYRKALRAHDEREGGE